MNHSDQHTVIGRIGSSYGVHGWVHLRADPDLVKQLIQHSDWLIEYQGQFVCCKMESARPHKGAFVAKFSLIDSPETAKRYANCTVAIPTQQLPALAEGEFYQSELIDMAVVTVTGLNLGTVADIMETGANDVLVIDTPQRRLIPYTDDAIKQVDKESNTITVDWDPDF